MTWSFRSRVFGLAALTVAAVLVLVGVLGWSSVMRFGVDRLDDRLCQEARRLMAPRGPGAPMPPDMLDNPSRLAADLLPKLRLVSPGQLMLRITGQGGATLLQTSTWSPLLAGDLHWTRASPVSGPGDEGPGPQRGGPAERPPPWMGDERPGGRRDPAANDALQAETPGRQGRPDGARSTLARPPRGMCSLASFTDNGRGWRAAKFEIPAGPTTLLAADLAATKDELQAALRGAAAWVLPLALLFTALGAWLLAGMALRPVNRLRDAMKAVTPNALHRRLPSQGEDREFQEVIATYNTMLSRLEASFHQATRFSADAAHELKTPLTILRGRVEQALAKSNNRAIQVDLSEMLDEVGRLASITRKLLLLSQADAGQLAVQREDIKLSEWLTGLAQDTQMLLSNQNLRTSIEPGLALRGDALLLGQLLNNLISNAVRYGRVDGWIELQARAVPLGVQVVVANDCRAVPEGDRQRWFERFYRGDAAHNRGADGHGLGLSLAREIARAHGGDLTLLDSPLDEVRLCLTLPKLAPKGSR